MSEELRTVLTLVGSAAISYLVATRTVRYQLRAEREERKKENLGKEEARLTLTKIEAWLLERISADERVWQPKGESHPHVDVAGRGYVEPAAEVLDALESICERHLVRVPAGRSKGYSIKNDGKRALELYLEKKSIDAVDWRPDEPPAAA